MKIESGFWHRMRPNEPGWYWFQADKEWKPPIRSLVLNPRTPPAIVLVSKKDGLCFCCFPAGNMWVSTMEGSWAGPILEPKWT